MRFSLRSMIRNTSTLFRVFFVIAIIGVVGLVWQLHGNLSTTVKSPGGSFTEGIIGAPRFINPVLAQSQSDKDLTQLVFAPLVSVDYDGNVDFRLAEHIDISPDGKKYTVELKQDAVFHDKKPITADDVLFTVEKIQDPLIKSPLLGRWQGVLVKKIDTYTVEFSLARPYSDFMYNLELGILPKHIWENVNEQEFIFSNFNTNPVGSGPYSVSSISFKENGVPKSYVLERTRDAYISTITFIFFDNEEDLNTAYKKGDVDAMYGFSFNSSLTDVRKHDRLISGTLPRVFGIFFNQAEQPIFQDKNIRNAINYALDKQSIVDQVFLGYAEAINTPFSSDNPSSTEYDPAHARELIERSGWKLNDDGVYAKQSKGNETKFEFNLSVLNTEEMQALADHIANDLKVVGITVNIRSFDQGNLSQEVIRPRQYQALLFGYEIEKPSDIYAFWHSSQRNDPGLNISLYANKIVDKELNTLRTDSDKANKEAIIKEIKNDVPAVFVYSPRFTYILPKKIKMDVDMNELKNASDRFSHTGDWYIQTRRVWNSFVK